MAPTLFNIDFNAMLITGYVITVSKEAGVTVLKSMRGVW